MMLEATAQTGKWTSYPAYKDSGVEWLGEVPDALGGEATQVSPHPSTMKYCPKLLIPICTYRM